MANFLCKLGQVAQELEDEAEGKYIRIYLVTARSAPSELRIMKTLTAWAKRARRADADDDEVITPLVHEFFFMGGLDKTPVLQAIEPHIFFDDSVEHVQRANAARTPSGHVSSGIKNSPRFKQQLSSSSSSSSTRSSSSSSNSKNELKVPVAAGAPGCRTIDFEAVERTGAAAAVASSSSGSKRKQAASVMFDSPAKRAK
jgi:hypothetical protein